MLRNSLQSTGNNIKKHEQTPIRRKKNAIIFKLLVKISYFRYLRDASANFGLHLHFLVFLPFLLDCMKNALNTGRIDQKEAVRRCHWLSGDTRKVHSNPQIKLTERKKEKEIEFFNSFIAWFSFYSSLNLGKDKRLMGFALVFYFFFY